nr:AAA family ATPase [Rosenbergiella collisarenosi]
MQDRDSEPAVELNYVLVIDEINRGNISKIFGELITLLEPSKRSGNAESLELVLPYSGERFSVPNNLYIIGTMNTADRSLAIMDTALRRRFDFVEMMPTPALLGDVEVEGIELGTLLHTMNQRIEVLYDREHALGHAFFMPVKKFIDSGESEKAFAELQSVFKNKIIPLLEEYFYEDWDKIRLVLGDNQKAITSAEDISALQFVRNHPIDYQLLFGSHYESDDYEQPTSQYHLASPLDGVWGNPKAYKAIYATLGTHQNADS